MKTKFSWMYLAALVAAFTWTSCSPDEEVPAPAVGITEIKVTPQGSAVSYTATITDLTAVVGIPFDVTDAALGAATVEATPTLGTEVYYNNEPVGAGVVVDLTSPVTLVAKGANDVANAYTLSVSRVSSDGADMVIKSSKFLGFPAGLYDYDVTYFNGKFYAITTALSGAGTENDPIIENYQLFSSADAINWSEVKYNTSTVGVSLPEGQNGYVIGGEGARLAVHKGRMYVLGGARTMGVDIYGNEAESMWGVYPAINNWRSFSTADGVNFECDTVASTLTYTHYSGETRVIATSDAASLLGSGYVNTVSFNGKLFMQGGHSPVYGTWQGARIYAVSEDGKNWESITPVSTSEENVIDVQYRISNSLFVYNNKMWCLGGFQNFVSATDAMKTSVWSSEDGINWTMEVDAVAGFSNIVEPKVLATDEAVYMFGGMVYDGVALAVSNKVYRSTDCINWEEVETPETFTARRHIAGVAQGNSAWLFGGITTPATGHYAAPVSDTDEFTTDTWVKFMK